MRGFVTSLPTGLLSFLIGVPFAIEWMAVYPYEPIKIRLFFFGVVGAWIWMLGSLLWRGRLRVWWHDVVERAQALDGVIAAWLVTILTASTFSIFPAMSLFGSPERMTGAWFYLAVGLLAFFVRCFGPVRVSLWHLRWLVAVTMIICIYACLQALGIDVVPLKNVFLLYGRSGPMRAFSTLGHPNYLGAYLAMTVPLFLYGLKIGTRFDRVVFTMMVIVSGVVTLLTYSRGAWLAWIAAMVVAASIYHAPTKKQLKIGVTLVGLGLLIAIPIFLHIRSSWLKSRAPLLYRLAASTNIQDGSIQARVAEWRYALPFIRQRPILGYGIGTYPSVSFLRQKSVDEHARDFRAPDATVADRLHLIWLDTLWSGGIVWLSCWIALFCLVGQRLWRAYQASPADRIWIASLAGSLVGYIAYMQTGFDFSISGIWLGLLLGWTGGVGSVRVEPGDGDAFLKEMG